MNDQAIGIERGNLEQGLSLLHRRAQHLAEVPGDDDAVEGRENAGARELLLRQRQLRFGLPNLGLQDDEIAAVVLGQRIAMPLHELVALGAPLQAVENEITVIKRSQEVAALHGVTGASGSGTNEPFERHNGGALHFGFEHRLGGDAVLALRKDEKQSERDGADRAELETLAPWTDQRRKAVSGMIDDAAGDKSVRLQLQSDNRPQSAPRWLPPVATSPS